MQSVDAFQDPASHLFESKLVWKVKDKQWSGTDAIRTKVSPSKLK